MISKIKLELSDGRKVTGRSPETLQSADKTKAISLVFDTCEIYSGFMRDIDEDGNIHLTKPSAMVGIILPLNRLVTWFYKEV